MTRRLLDLIRRGWPLLSPVQRVGVVLFQAAWLAQIGLLAYLVLR